MTRVAPPRTWPCLAALEEARDSLRIRAERAEADLDTTRADNRQLAEQLDRTSAGVDIHPEEPASAPSPRRARKPAATRNDSSS